MPRARYDGPAHVFKLNEDDKGTKRGEIGNFPKSVMDHYSQEGKGTDIHSWTLESDLNAGAVKEADAVAKSDPPVRVEERRVTGANSGI